MTREEALQYLYDFRDNVSWDGMPEEALDMAIKALEQEPTANNDCAELNGCISCSLDDGDDCCRKLYEESMQEPITKNDLGVDWENYKDADGNCLDDLILEVLQNNFDCGNTYGYKVADEIIELLPSVTPQEPQTFKWCTDCREYDQEKHCCHRWSKVIRDTVEEMKQESILDKIRAEIRANSIYVMPQYGRTIREADVLHIIDKYKAETEET